MRQDMPFYHYSFFRLSNGGMKSMIRRETRHQDSSPQGTALLAPRILNDVHGLHAVIALNLPRIPGAPTGEYKRMKSTDKWRRCDQDSIGSK